VNSGLEIGVNGSMTTRCPIGVVTVSCTGTGFIYLRMAADGGLLMESEDWAAVIPELYAHLPDDLKYQVLRAVDGG
jgi:hypothetical protein